MVVLVDYRLHGFCLSELLTLLPIFEKTLLPDDHQVVHFLVVFYDFLHAVLEVPDAVLLEDSARDVRLGSEF